MRARIRAAGLWASLVLAPQGAWATDVPVTPRAPAALLVITAPGRAPAASTGALLAAADHALARHTRLEIRSLEQLGVDPDSLRPCRSGLRLSCWARTLRGQASDARLRFAFVLALIPLADGREQASVLLLDLERAARLSERAAPDDPDAAAAVEDELFAQTPSSRPARLDLTDPERRRAYFAGVVRDDFAQPLEAAGVLGALGDVDVRGARAGWPVFVDGDEVGVTAGPRTRLVGVPVGRRTIGVRAPWGEVVQSGLTVSAEQAALVWVEPPPAGVHPGRLAVRWGGVAMAAAGLSVLAVGLARAGDGAAVTCLRRPGDVGGCPGLGTPTTGYDPGRAPATDPATVDGGGLALVPFGVALSVAGAGASAAAWTLPEDSEFPWWPTLVAVLAGGLTYGVGHAVAR